MPASSARTTDSTASSGDSSRAGGSTGAATSRTTGATRRLPERGRACGSRRWARSSTDRRTSLRSAGDRPSTVSPCSASAAGSERGPRPAAARRPGRLARGRRRRPAAAGRRRRAAARRSAARQAGRRAPTAARCWRSSPGSIADGARDLPARRLGVGEPAADGLVGRRRLDRAALDQGEGGGPDDLDGVGRGAAGPQHRVVDPVEVHPHRCDRPVGGHGRGAGGRHPVALRHPDSLGPAALPTLAR